jgi:hypothetical protein
MNKKLLQITILISCLFYFNNGFAQDSLKSHHWALKTDLTSLINPDFPAFTISGERFIAPNYSLELNIGYSNISPYGIKADTQFYKPIVLKVSGELKIFIHNFINPANHSYRRAYIAIQEYYQYEQFNASTSPVDSLFHPVRNIVDNFTVFKQIFGFNVKIGEEWIMPGNHLILDTWIGFGLKYRQVSDNYLDVNAFDATNSHDPIILFNFIRKESLFYSGSGLKINLPLGVKIGYLF